jgi:hypothetical protein
MKGLRLVHLAVGIAGVTALTLGLHRLFGAVGFVFAAPAWGALLALPLLEAAGAALRLLRRAQWAGVEGRYYEHRGRWVDIVEDGAGRRFVRIAHVRRFLPGLPPDETIARIYPDRIRHAAPRAPAYLRDDALADYLAGTHTSDATKLRLWLQRDVIVPGTRRRELKRTPTSQ